MNSIHIKLDYDEAINIKKGALIIEKELLQAIGYVNAYNNLRRQEFALKAKIKRDFLALESTIEAIKAMLPIDELGLVKKEIKQVVKQAIKKSPQIIEKNHSTLDQELQEIKEKLARLG